MSAAGDTVTELTLWATDTVALPETAPAVAVIVAVPLPAAVTRPELSTVATAALPLAQVTVAPVMTWPSWSRTSARSCTVAPRAVSSAAAGVTATVVGRGGSGGGGSVAPSPQPATQAKPAVAATTSTRVLWQLSAVSLFNGLPSAATQGKPVNGVGRW